MPIYVCCHLKQKELYTNEGVLKKPCQRLVAVIGQLWKVGKRRKLQHFDAAAMSLLFFFEIYKRGLKRAGSIDLSNQVTNYDTRSGLP